MVALESETKFLFNGSGKGLAKPLQLVDEDGDGGLGAENVFLFFVDGFALGNSFFHLCDTVVFLAEATESLVYETENRSIGHVRGRHCSPLLCCSAALLLWKVAFSRSTTCDRAPFGGGGERQGF